MTSLDETLPILDREVPALPGKVEAVAAQAAALQHAAEAALASMEAKRKEFEALGERIEHTLQTLRAQTAAHVPLLTGAAVGLRLACDEEEGRTLQGRDALRKASDQSETASAALLTALQSIADGTEDAHDDAAGAVSDLSGRADTSDTEVDGAAEALATASATVGQACDEGRQRVTGGGTVLHDTLLRLLAAAETRLAQTEHLLDEVRSGQERTVAAAVETLDAGRRAVEEELRRDIRSAVQEELGPVLASGEQALDAFGQDAVGLESESATAREALATELEAVGGRLPRLRDGAVKVREAAAQVGIPWP